MNRYSVHNSFCKAWEAMSAKSDDFLDKLRKSGWLAAVDTTLWVASLTAQAVRQAPVIVHGGDGIDMTLVVTSLTQIILLPEGDSRLFEPLKIQEFSKNSYRTSFDNPA